MMYLWKEWNEQIRGKGLWLAIIMVVFVSLIIMMETLTLPVRQGHEALLLSLYEINVYLIPLLSLFITSFAVLQEKEWKTLMILTTKRESFRSFLFKKSMAIQLIILGVFTAWYMILAVPMKVFFDFQAGHFLAFLFTIATFLIIFNQIGIFLGSICSTRMQLVGANIFTWFFFVFVIDLLFMNMLPNVSYENVTIFSVFYFLDPLHTLSFYLNTSLGVLSLEHLSRMMEKLVWMSPGKFLLVDLIVWTVISFELAVKLGKGGINHD